MKFTLEIELGNDAMQTMENVADALVHTAGRLSMELRSRFPVREDSIESGKIYDLNANPVGRWEIS